MQTLPPDYVTSVCDSFAELGTQAVSFFTMSGNVGVGAGVCEFNDGWQSLLSLPVPLILYVWCSVAHKRGFKSLNKSARLHKSLGP